MAPCKQEDPSLNLGTHLLKHPDRELGRVQSIKLLVLKAWWSESGFPACVINQVCDVTWIPVLERQVYPGACCTAGKSSQSLSSRFSEKPCLKRWKRGGKGTEEDTGHWPLYTWACTRMHVIPCHTNTLYRTKYTHTHSTGRLKQPDPWDSLATTLVFLLSSKLVQNSVFKTKHKKVDGSQ